MDQTASIFVIDTNQTAYKLIQKWTKNTILLEISESTKIKLWKNPEYPLHERKHFWPFPWPTITAITCNNDVIAHVITNVIKWNYRFMFTIMTSNPESAFLKLLTSKALPQCQNGETWNDWDQLEVLNQSKLDLNLLCWQPLPLPATSRHRLSVLSR